MKLDTKMLRIAVGAAALALASIATYVAAQPNEKVIRIGAKRFDYTPGELTLKKGEPVILEFTSSDVLMGFNLPDFNLRADIIPDKVTRTSASVSADGIGMCLTERRFLSTRRAFIGRSTDFHRLDRLRFKQARCVVRLLRYRQ